MEKALNEAIFQENLALLGRYRPDLVSFFQSPLFSDVIQYPSEQEAIWWKKWNIVKDHRVVFFYGCGSGEIYLAAKQWLRENPHSRLVLLEDDSQKFFSYLHTSNATEALKDPQVLVHFFHNSFFAKLFLEEIIWSCLQYNQPRVQFILLALPSYAKEKKESHERLRRDLIYISSWADHLFEELEKGGPVRLWENYFSNLFSFLRPSLYLASQFEGIFSGIPAIICGAGPSLEKHLETLKRLQDKALIFAGGSAINCLCEGGVIPHFCVGIDPNLTHYSRVLTQTAFERPYFYTFRMESHAVEAIQAPLIFLTKKKREIDHWFSDRLFSYTSDLGNSFSVGNVALQAAQLMGCNPIIFAGMDLAKTEARPYAKGVFEHPLIKNKKKYKEHVTMPYLSKDFEGKETHTTFQFLQESKWISTFVQAHPQTTFLNATEGGLPIKNVPNLTLQEVESTYLQKIYAFKEWIHAHTQVMVCQSVTPKKLKDLLKEFKEGLNRCLESCQEILRLLDEPTIGSVEKLAELSHFQFQLANESVFFYYLAELDMRMCRILFSQDRQWRSKNGHLQPMLLQGLSFESLKKRYRFLEEAISSSLSIVRKEIERETSPEVKIPTGMKPLPLPELTPEKWILSAPREGEISSFYPSGALYSRERYTHGELDGLQEFFYEDGALKTLFHYSQGLLDGEVFFYYPNSICKREIHFVKGKREGWERSWDEQGHLRMELHYHQNQPDQVAKSWDENHQAEMIITYPSPGVIGKIEEWDSEGKKIQ